MTAPTFEVDFVATTDLVWERPEPQVLALDFRAVAQEDFRFLIPSTADPITGITPYRVLIVDMYGQQYGEVENARLSSIMWAVNGKGVFTFAAPVEDEKIQEIAVPEREVQVWRGGRMLWWGVIVRARADSHMVEFQCQTVEWYFDRRLMGPIPRVGHFKGPHLEFGTNAWKGGHLPGTRPARNPVKGLVSDFRIAGGNSMILAPSGGRTAVTHQADDWFTTSQGAVLTDSAKTQINSIMAGTFGDNPMVTVNVYHDNSLDSKVAKQITRDRADAITEHMQKRKPGARIDATGLGERQAKYTNRTAAGRAQNRRIDISYRNDDAKRGHGQFVSQTFAVKVPRGEERLRCTLRGWVFIESFEGPAANNWGLVIERQDVSKLSKNKDWAREGFKRVYSRAYVPISKSTPRKRWIRMEASVMVPADNKTYVIEGRLFPPLGMSYWDEVDLFTDDALDYVNEEQANIVRDLIDHAQDETLGKSYLNIERRVLKTEVKRTRRYAFSERTVIGDHLNEFTTLGEGMEWDIICTPTRRILKTYYPRKERRTGYVLKLGQNALAFDVDVDGLTTSSSVVVMANDVEAHAREERAVVDDSLIDGVTMEMAYLATPGSSVSSLQHQARRGIERYRKPTRIPTLTTNPAFADEILNRVQTGDIVDVDVRTGWYDSITKHRVLDMSLDPNTEQVTMTLMPEDTPVRVITGWEGQWRYKNQAQGGITGTSNTVPKQSNKEYASRDYDDSGWSTARAGFGWYTDGTAYSQQPDLDPKTVVATNHEVWMRKHVRVTEEMYVSGRFDRWAFIYVNGKLLRSRPFIGRNFSHAFLAPTIRVPQDFLDPSGWQVVAVHVQARLKNDGPPRALYADLKIRGIYDPSHVGQ